MKSTVLLILTVAFGLLAGWLAYPYVMELAAADACLDRGGSFDYAREVCDELDGHDYVPYWVRRPVEVAVFAVSTLASAACWVGWLVGRAHTKRRERG